MKKNKSNRVLLWTLKNKALALRNSYQLPLYLTTLIYNVTNECNVDYVRCLLNLTEQLLRVKGFYKKFPQADKESKDIVVKYLNRMGF